MINEFYRMCNAFGWRGYGDGREEAKVLFKHILAREFRKIGPDVQENHQSLGETSATIISSFVDPTITPLVTDAQALKEVHLATSARIQR